MSKMEDLKLDMQAWSSQHFGNIPKAIKTLQVKILRLEGQVSAEQELDSLKMKLQELMEVENGYWKQRSRLNWLTKGDRNTKYFHHHANHRQQRNSIRKGYE